MPVKEEELLRLYAATPKDEIKQRQGQRQHQGSCDKPCRQPHAMLDYVDARYVMGVLDKVCGPANWQRTHAMDGAKVVCNIGINVEGVGWVWKGDGAGETDIEGEKGSFSDAFKRAAVSWGIARDLYGPRTRSTAADTPKPASAKQKPAEAPSPTVPPNQPWTAEEIASVGLDGAQPKEDGWGF